MAPRRGETAKDRREGETAELGERVSNVEAKISKLETVVEEKLEAMSEAIRQLMETLAQMQIQMEKRKEANPNPNPENSSVEEGDSLVGGASQTQFPNGEALGQPRITGGGGMVGQGGRPQGRNSRPAAAWVDAGQGGVGQQGPTLRWTVDTAGGHKRFYAGQHGRSNGQHPRPAAPWVGYGQEEADHYGGTMGGHVDHLGGGQGDLAAEYGLYGQAGRGGQPDCQWQEHEGTHHEGARGGRRRAGQARGAFHHGPWGDGRHTEGSRGRRGGSGS